MHRIDTQRGEDRPQDWPQNDDRGAGIQKHANNEQQNVDQKQQDQRVV